MPAYITLYNFTDQGIKEVKGTVKRAKAFKNVVEQARGRVIGVWWTLGQYDLVGISEVPDEETGVRLSLLLGMSGNARSTTLRAFSEDEMEKIVSGLP